MFEYSRHKRENNSQNWVNEYVNMALRENRNFLPATKSAMQIILPFWFSSSTFVIVLPVSSTTGITS